MINIKRKFSGTFEERHVPYRATDKFTIRIQWNLGLCTSRFTFVSVYVWQFVENVASVYVQKFGLRALL